MTKKNLKLEGTYSPNCHNWLPNFRVNVEGNPIYMAWDFIDDEFDVIVDCLI